MSACACDDSVERLAAMTRDAPDARHILHDTTGLVTLCLVRELLFVAGGALEQQRIRLELAIWAEPAFDDGLGMILKQLGLWPLISDRQRRLHTDLLDAVHDLELQAQRLRIKPDTVANDQIER